MAKYPNGIAGPFIGKVGPVVGSSRLGVYYMKSIPERRTSPPKPAEKANQTKFAVAQYFLSPLKFYLRIGFHNNTSSRGFVAAKSWLLNNSFIKDAPSPTVDPSKVLISKGDMATPVHASARQNQQGNIEVSWDTTSGNQGDWLDQVMVAAYDIENGKCLGYPVGQLRKDGKVVIESSFDKGSEVHVYLAFISVDRIKRSDSVYLGMLTIV